MKGKIFKIVKFLFFSLFIFYLGVIISYNFLHWQHFKMQKEIEEWPEKALRKYYLTDTYGGKTPEETLNLFIDALKKQDIDLAVKYVKDTEAEGAKDDLEEIVKEERSGKLIEDLENLQPGSSMFPNWDFTFVLLNEEGIGIYSVRLERNEYNNIWKIARF